jgi:2-dehydropantoate 2-reductase
MTRPRLCVVGAGAIGGLLAARLALAGESVSVIARGEHLRAIRTAGLRLREVDGSERVATGITATDDIAALGPQDVVILALKAHQIAVLADRLPLLYGPETVVVPVQNGIPWWYFERHGGPYEGRRLQALDPDGAIAAAVPAERIVASIPYPAAEKSAPGVITHVEGDKFPVGELDGSRSERALALAEMLSRAGFTARVLADIRAQLWVKGWGNLAFNPISALTGATLAGICREPRTRALAATMMTEAAAIAEALGVRIRISIEQRIAGAAAVGEHRTSMLQDLEAGTELELDPLVGVFVELGDLVGVPTPAIAAVYACATLLDRQRAEDRRKGRP